MRDKVFGNYRMLAIYFDDFMLDRAAFDKKVSPGKFCEYLYSQDGTILGPLNLALSSAYECAENIIPHLTDGVDGKGQGNRSLSFVDEALAGVEQGALTYRTVHPVEGLSELVEYCLENKVKIAFFSRLRSTDMRRVSDSVLGRGAVGTFIGRECFSPGVFSFDEMVSQCVQKINAYAPCFLVSCRSEPIVTYLAGKKTNLRLVGSDEGSYSDVVEICENLELREVLTARINKLAAVRNRVNELRSINKMTNEQMAEYAELTGGIRVIGNSRSFGYVDEEKGVGNARLLEGLRLDAARAQHILELICIDCTLMEIDLRNWSIIQRGSDYSSGERKTFGEMIGDLRGESFNGAILARLQKFNDLRNKAVHRLSIGEVDYMQLVSSYMSDPCLLSDLREYILDRAPVIGRSAHRF